MANILGLGVRIGGDNTGFLRALKQGETVAAGVGKRIAASFAGLFAFSKLTQGLRDVVNFGAKISALSLRTGLSTDLLQKLDTAALKSGTSLDILVRSLRKVGEARVRALSGDVATTAFFEELGISIEDLKKQDLEGVWRAVGEAFRTIDFGPAELFLAGRLLGEEAGPATLALFKTGLEEALQAVEDLDAGLDKLTLEQLDDAASKLAEVKAQLRGPFAETLLFLIDIVTALGNGFRIAARAADGFNKIVQEAVPSAVKNVFGLAGKLVEPGAELLAGGKNQREAIAAENAQLLLRLGPSNVENLTDEGRKVIEDTIAANNERLKELGPGISRFQKTIDRFQEVFDELRDSISGGTRGVKEEFVKLGEDVSDFAGSLETPKGGIVDKIVANQLEGIEDPVEAAVKEATERVKKLVDPELFRVKAEKKTETFKEVRAASQGVSQGAFFGASQAQLLTVNASRDRHLERIAEATANADKTAKESLILQKASLAKPKKDIFE